MSNEVYCSFGNHVVPESEAVQVDERIGPDLLPVPVYTCFACTDDEGVEAGASTSTQAFTVGQQVRITRQETWQGRVDTIVYRSKHDPTMYLLRRYGYRRNDEIEPVTSERGVP